MMREPDAPLVAHAAAKPSHVANVRKVLHWAQIVEAAADDECLALLDCDTVVLKSLDDIWGHPFDLAYTVRPADCALPFNSGVLFLRVSPRVRDFVRVWADLNVQMLADQALHDEWRAEFGGINQAAFGALLRMTSVDDLHLALLPCQVWNCEDFTWATASDDTRILHVKGALRAHLFGLTSEQPTPEVWRLANQWRALAEAVD